MSFTSVKILILVSILLMGMHGKFSEEPDYEFTIWDETKPGKLFMIDLSTDDDQLAVISFDKSSLRYFMTVYNFDGTIVCDYDYPMQYFRVGWASQTGGFYLDVIYKYILKSITVCGDPQYLASQRGFIQGITFTSTSKKSSVAFAYNNNQVVEYDLGSGAVLKQFDFDNSTERLKSIQFTPEHEYLYSVVTTNENKSKVIIFDADSGERKSQIQTDLQFIKENSKHDGFLATDKDQVNFYNVDKDGNSRQIWTPSTDPYADEAPVQVCTDDIRIMALRISGSKENSKYEMISYDSDDGSNLQTFQLNFIPNLNIQNPFRCNDNYLSIFDTEGKVHIFKYSRPLPVWAIILIVIGSLLIVGGFIGVGIFIYKKKQNSQKLGKYQQFNMQEKTRNDL